MPRKPTRRGRPEVLSRHLIVDRSEVSLGTHPGARHFGPHSAYIQMVGHLDEPLTGVTEAQLQVSVSDDEDDKRVGAIIDVKPVVRLVIGTPTRQFDLLWAIAVANRCRSVHFAFTAPVRGSAHIVSWYASTRLPDEE
ncbi:hypothetical protein [Alsobacter sp. R-9]